MSLPPLLVETVVADGARYHVWWFDPPFRPPLANAGLALFVVSCSTGC